MGHRGTYWWNIAASAFIFLTVQALIGAMVEAIQEDKVLLLIKLILFEAGIGLVMCGLLYAGLKIARSSTIFVTPTAQRAVPGDIWRRLASSPAAFREVITSTRRSG
jgi:hypothetical protein